MRSIALLFISVILASLWPPGLAAQARTVAITVDDLPYAGADLDSADAGLVNRALFAAFTAHHVPVTGFVIQKRVESFSNGVQILKDWIGGGFDLGNHTYSHADFNELSAEEMEREIVKGESAIQPLLKEAARKLTFFRFPMNHMGDTKEKQDAIAAFLSHRGYRLAPCTIDNSDYLFNDAYIRMIAKKDREGERKLRSEYLSYTSAEIDYYSALNKQVLGYEPPEVMLLHDNRLNSDVMEQVLQLFERKQYRFVSLEAALADAAYQKPATYATRFGPMWGYRWARERNVKVNGSLEPDPPKWILEYR